MIFKELIQCWNWYTHPLDLWWLVGYRALSFFEAGSLAMTMTEMKQKQNSCKE